MNFILLYFIYFISSISGQSKPRSICYSKGTENELRINTYTAWANNVKNLQNICTRETFEILDANNCGDFIPNPVNFGDFLQLVNILVSTAYDDNLWYVRLGGVSTDFSGVIPYKKPGKNEEKKELKENINLNKNNGVGMLDVLVVKNSSFSIRVFDRDGSRLLLSSQQLSKVAKRILIIFHFRTLNH